MKYQLFNETDQIMASPSKFATKEKAAAYAETLRKRFIMQGYYLTAAGTRIRPEDLKLAIVPAES